MSPTAMIQEEAMPTTEKAKEEAMSSTGKAKEEAILPPDAFEYVNSIKLHQPEFLDLRKIECERILSRIQDAYSLPFYGKCDLKELLQWLHRFDFTQDDEIFFRTFLGKIMGDWRENRVSSSPILQTQTHDFFLEGGSLRTMRAAHASDPDDKHEKDEKSMKLIHEFVPALQIECDADTEERVLPLRFGLPVGRLLCWNKKGRTYGDDGYSAIHLVFHPIDKSFWIVVDRYLGPERFDDYPEVEDDWPDWEYQDKKLLTRTLRDRFEKGDDIVMAEAFRLGTKDLWFPQGFGLSELDGDKPGDPVPKYDARDGPPTIEFSSLPKVSLFRDTEPLQVRFATRSSFQSYLTEHGVVKGRSWRSVSSVPN
ncbi:hypothetical protein AYL99_11714 [Fonsecaea erecta]|uniref:Uncharacterized protein n=1 Tax=Fonsecaea erecta TaxID=1367422 RepID=A0A178Z300_9EURO|nr:hypothetical protein AYL99_11714 [Fonsecaea erecta]OAP54179.1 hypothetical protein AYL99_11714 [Fonsecaea erecta]